MRTKEGEDEGGAAAGAISDASLHQLKGFMGLTGLKGRM